MSRKQSEQGSDDALMAQIHHMFAEPLPPGDEPFPWYRPPGGTAELNGLLDIATDEDFIDAAVWHLQGRELIGRKRRRWLKRLRFTSRGGIVAALRLKTAGRRHGVHVPGLWWALLLHPPFRALPGARWLSTGPVFRYSCQIRRRVVAWRQSVWAARASSIASNQTNTGYTSAAANDLPRRKAS